MNTSSVAIPTINTLILLFFVFCTPITFHPSGQITNINQLTEIIPVDYIEMTPCLHLTFCIPKIAKVIFDTDHLPRHKVPGIVS